MKCNKCSFVNDPDARFCNQCGTALNLACPQCKNNNAPGSKFCKSCGYSFEQSSDGNIDVKPIPKTGTTGKKICSACHTINEGTAQFCFKCGVALPSEVTSQAQIFGNPAGFWRRLAAFVLDSIIVFSLDFGILWILSGFDAGKAWELISSTEIKKKAPFFATVLELAVNIAYYTYSIGKWGKTIGKASLGLKVTRVDGSKLTYWRSFARLWTWNLSLVILGIGHLMIALTSQKRGLHDYMCDTRVLKRI